MKIQFLVDVNFSDEVIKRSDVLNNICAALVERMKTGMISPLGEPACVETIHVFMLEGDEYSRVEEGRKIKLGVTGFHVVP